MRNPFKRQKQPVKLDISLPRGWNELTDTNLYYLFNLIADNMSAAQIKTHCLMQWGKLAIQSRYGNGYIVKRGHVKAYIDAEIIVDAIQYLNWIENIPDYPVSIRDIAGAKAVPNDLQGVPFNIYIICDNLYQGFLHTQQPALLQEMAAQLYGSNVHRLNRAERQAVFYWWTTLKNYFAKKWPHFLQSADGDTTALAKPPIAQQLQEAMDSQIRALTKGDITKEADILAMDCWRALTELDALAREAQEMKRKYKH